MLSKYDLAHKYIEKNFNNLPDIKVIQIIQAIEGALDSGCTYQDVNKRIELYNETGENWNIFFKNIKPSGNLLKQDKFYYHPELRCIADAPTRYWDINTGEIIYKEQEYFLEMKASYSLEDLYNYISSKASFANVIKDKKRTIGSLKYLTDKYDIETVLFMVDTVVDMYLANQKLVRNVLEIAEYDCEAKVNFDKKVTESKINGDYKITIKSRPLFNLR